MDDKIAQLEQFILEDPTDSFSIYALALEFSKLNNFEKAKMLLLDLKEKNPAYLALYYQLGKLYELTENKDIAIEIYREGVNIAIQQNNSHTKAELLFALEDLE
jgi:tetratricopeptide (TPR) repeat protein